ncbi:MAG: hypothetical protein A2176_05165 [Spirochaetes bacterium RBG_13_51_14]|nr:MAG: hypothetical protein A2176_05165 [Spirochaetes bacterium RBG_13_51_14]
MDSVLQLRGEGINEFAHACHEKIRSASSKIEALQLIASFTSSHLEECRRPVQENPDEISINFIELLDQIAFELTENMPPDSTVRGYITEDLISRLAIYLDIFCGKETYSSNLNKRLLTHEDTIIIRQCGFNEYIPLLMVEYYEQPVLQRSILHALLSFDREDLLNFYYNIAKERGGIEVKILALAGLKNFGAAFRYWDLLMTDNEEYNRLIAYATSFDGAFIENNEIHGDLYSLLFALQFIESSADPLKKSRALTWILRMLQAVPAADYYNSYLPDVYNSVCNILLYAGLDSMKQLVDDEEQACALIMVLDFLPCEYFDRISHRLTLIGDIFVQRVNGLLAAKKIKLNENDSNIISYILWKTGSSL